MTHKNLTFTLLCCCTVRRKPWRHLVLCFHLQGSEQEGKGLPCKKGIVQSVVGQGYQRKIILASQSTQSSVYRLVFKFIPPRNDPTTKPHKLPLCKPAISYINSGFVTVHFFYVY